MQRGIAHVSKNGKVHKSRLKDAVDQKTVNQETPGKSWKLVYQVNTSGLAVSRQRLRCFGHMQTRDNGYIRIWAKGY